MERSIPSAKLTIGAKMPDFRLKSVDESFIDNSYFNGASCMLVIFTCNHCPYVKGSEKLLNTLVGEYHGKGLKVMAISSNDTIRYPEDSFEKMKEKVIEYDITYPYLFDESQQVAKSFDAACTPECYLFDKDAKLIFHGTICDNPKDSTRVKKEYLREALEQYFSGSPVNPPYVNPIGCSIKWKQT